MKENIVNIEISKSDVYQRVRTLASYLGSKDEQGGDKGSYDRISLSEADDIMLDRVWSKCVTALVAVYKRYLKTNNSTSTEFNITLSMPLAFNSGLHKLSLEEATAEYLANDVLAEVLEIENSDKDVQYYSGIASDKELEIRTILSEREIEDRSCIDRHKQETVIIEIE